MRGLLSMALGLLVLSLCGNGGSAARADEEKIALDKLPKAVLEAAKARFPKANLVRDEKASVLLQLQNGSLFFLNIFFPIR